MEPDRRGRGVRPSTAWLAGIGLLSLAACTDPYSPGQRALGGAGLGAGGGAALGAIAGGGHGAAIGALAGGALGALGGYATTPTRAAGQQGTASPYGNPANSAVAPAYYGQNNGVRTPAPGAYVGQPQQGYGQPAGYAPSGYNPPGYAPSGYNAPAAGSPGYASPAYGGASQSY